MNVLIFIDDTWFSKKEIYGKSSVNQKVKRQVGFKFGLRYGREFGLHRTSDKSKEKKKKKLFRQWKLENISLPSANCILLLFLCPLLVGNGVGILMGKLNAQGPALKICNTTTAGSYVVAKT